jgi:type III secretion protein J
MNQKHTQYPSAVKALLSPTFFKEKFLLLLALFGIIMLAFSGCESTKTIVNGIDEREANEILVLLASKNIDAYKLRQESGRAGGGGAQDVLWDIAVNATDATSAMAILSAHGLPRRRSQNLLELFSAGGLVPSEMQQKIRYQAGLADQIATTIRKIDGVIDADVQLSFPEEDPLNPLAKKDEATASVYVKHTGILDDPNSHLIAKIKRLVASAVQGLSFDNVTVIPDRARLTEPPLGRTRPQDVDYIRVWTIILAKDSLTRFQVLFFSMSLVLLLLFFVTFWFGWKLYPLLQKRGGISQLFHLTPLPDEYETEEEEEEESEEGDEEKEKATKKVGKPAEKEKKAKEEKKPPEEPKVQENVEEP